MSKKHKHKKGSDMVPKGANAALSGGMPGACWQSHPVLTIGGGKVLGASCLYPAKGYDIYVGLDWGMHRTTAFPWNPPTESSVIEVYFPITDGRAPADVSEFTKMIDWLGQQLAEGRSLHVGCIGGHGRTGLLLSALRAVLDKDTEAAAWSRKHHCTKSIETDEQVKFLTKHFGVSAVPPSRQWQTHSSSSLGSKTGELSSSVTASVNTLYSPVYGRSMWGVMISV